MAGDSSSDSSQTSSSTTNYQDRRNVADGGVAVSGDGSSAYMSSSTSTNVANSGNTTTTITNTDGGAFDVVKNLTNKTLDSMLASQRQSEQMALASLSSASDAVSRSNNNVVDMAKNTTSALTSGLDKLLGFGSDVLKLQANEQNMIEQTQKGVSEAYKTAASISSGQENIVKVGLVVAGVVGFAALASMKRG